MHHPAFFILAIFSLLGVAISVPTQITTSSATAAPTHVAPPTCTTYYPSVLRQLVESAPNAKQANTAKDTKSFKVAQSVSFADNVKFDRIHQYVVFDNIASGSWDCQLMISWPSSASLNVSTASRFGAFGSASVSLDVYSASYNASSIGSHSKPKASRVGTPDSTPFATWHSMMNAMRVPTGTDEPSVKGEAEKTHGKALSNTRSVTLTPFGTVGVNPGEYGVTINSKACPRANEDGALRFLFEIPSTDSRDASVGFLGSTEKGAGVYLLANC
ncbi:hypothetical protein N8I77_003859 [Diaporthe amygdali]|uniref:Ubiquitin 3 binding protein But2 C-terminal domain-containing protein n=1 Tax=Phomopsis amygdali TaxID=1214568 RepID=A0AAD9SKQ9_PHOAM|nr:hypothetical protein N8I77_003859 [Diaporthe amygdali]